MKREEAVLLLDQTFGAQRAQEIMDALSIKGQYMRECDEVGCHAIAGFATPDGVWCYKHEREHRSHLDVKVAAMSAVEVLTKGATP